MRPQTFDDFIGQDDVKLGMQMFANSARAQGIAMPHVLLYGPSGLGKTTLSNIVAGLQGGELHTVNARAINAPIDLVRLLKKLDSQGAQEPTPTLGKDILFIDEIHALPMKIEEMLYEVMEDFMITAEVDVSYPNDYGVIMYTKKEVQRMWVPRFTLIGATTVLGGISRPMRDRFGIQFELQPYSMGELAIIARGASELNITPEAAVDIAARSRGIARVAVNYLGRCKDIAYAIESNLIDEEVTKKTFGILGVDTIGLKRADYRYLSLLSDGRARGANAIALSLDEKVATIEETVEPYLLSRGLIERTTRGRIITHAGKEYIEEREVATAK